MRIGELFSGYGGLGMGVQSVLGGDIVWHSDIDKGACKILAHRYPDVPNLGDITAVDWSQVEPVEVLTGGFPCQDVSAAGRRAGIRPGTRSGLWSQFAYAISQLRPRMVVIENVRGLLSAEAHSDMEPCPWCVGDDADGALRALGAVLGDLASLGFNAEWRGLRAADVGAPHGRFRIFIVATDTRGERGPQALEHDGRGAPVGDRAGVPDEPDRHALRTGPERALALLPTPSVAGALGGHERRGGARGDELLLNGVAKELALLPTPTVDDARGGGSVASVGAGYQDKLHLAAKRAGEWGDYAAAIARWETVLGRPAPAPTMTSTKGNPQLSPVFVEWMMGLPPGWVTDVPGITRNEALRALGNGVVPQQCAAALRLMLGQEDAA